MSAIAVLLFAALTQPAAGSTDQAGPQARNRAVARRVFEEIFNQGKFEVAAEIYAPDFKNHGLHRDADLKADQDAVHAEKKAFPDLKMSVDMLAAEGDLVTALWTFRGTHTSDGYAGLPATGAKVEMRGITIWRVVNGKIQDEWTAFNDMAAYSQVIAQLKWTLFGILLAFVVAIVVLEHVLVWGVRAVVKRARA
jgi:steroid delta-isomerase-like uncharacterized protein